MANHLNQLRQAMLGVPAMKVKRKITKIGNGRYIRLPEETHRVLGNRCLIEFWELHESFVFVLTPKKKENPDVVHD